MLYRMFAAFALVLALSAIVSAENLTLGIGPNIVSPGPNTLTAQDLVSKTGCAFVAHTVIGADGRSRFGVYLPGSSPSFPLSPYQGYIISSPRTASVSLGSILVTSATSYAVVLYTYPGRVQILNTDGQLESSANIPATTIPRSGYDSLALFADSKQIYTLQSEGFKCDLVIDAFSIATSERSTVTVRPLVCPQRYSSPFIQRDGTIIFRTEPTNLIEYDPRTNQYTPLNFTISNYSPVAIYPVRRGSRLFWLQPDSKQKYQINRSGSTAITGEPNGVNRYAVSPDGTRIAYTTATTAGDGGSTEVKIMNTDGSNVMQVTQNHVFESSPAFLPDGSIIFITERNQPGEVYRVDSDGKNPRLFYQRSDGHYFNMDVIKK